MNKLPDLSDEKKLAEVGRRSLIQRARNEACEKFRDLAVALQSTDFWSYDVQSLCDEARQVIARIEEIKELTKR